VLRPTPLLILAYNRPDKMVGLIDSLRATRPQLLMIVVDGPKPGNPADAAKVQAVRDAVSGIDWGAEVRTRFRPVNVGLRASVTDAVSWAVAEYGQVAVLEEDVEPGPDFLPYVEAMLERYRDDTRIAHISGYNVVPPSQLASTSGSRLTAYPESIAWATWGRAWALYDDDLGWLRRHPAAELRAITGTRSAAIRWLQNFRDADSGRISTWAYRWIASIWSAGAVCLSPNVNLVRYVGHDDGTHTVTAAPWTELPVYDGPVEALLRGEPVADVRADAWVNRVVFRGTPLGVARGVAISAVLALRQARRTRRARS
jgi:glycosyltransferase involved in cell wall biosynthesis